MKRFIGLAVIIALLSFGCSAFATVAVKEEFNASSELYVGEATYLNIEGQDVSSDGSTITILANGHKDGVTTNVSTESNLTSAALAYGVIQLQAGTAKTVSLAAGTAGQMVTIIMTTVDGASITISDDRVSGTLQDAVVETGWDDIVFDALLDSVTLLYADATTGWIIIGQNGVTIT